MVGGEIPIRTTTTSSGGSSSQENINFKSYGIGLNVTPNIDRGKIECKLGITISDVDAANAVGENVAFTTRTATTVVFLNDGQTIVIAGLIRHNENETVRRVPFFSDVPVIGALFRTKSNPAANQEQEVVITLTPRILKDKKIDWKEGELIVEDYLAEEFEGDAEKKDFDEFELLDQSDEDEMDVAMEEEMLDMTEEEMLTEDLPANTSNISKIIKGYVKAVQNKIYQSISFPYEAKEQGWTGTTTLTLIILSDGSINEVIVKESSGHEIFDTDAINTTQILAPFEPFPSELDLEELEVTIPIVYSPDIIFDEV